MMLYRYLSEEFALQVLQTREWKVGRLLELNDPADCQPTLIGAPKQPNEAADAEYARNYRAIYLPPFPNLAARKSRSSTSPT